MNIILLGPPGSGKGTQAERIKNSFGFKKLSTGDLLRDSVKKKTKVGVKAAEIMKKGDLVSDELINELISEVMQVENSNNKGFILDGYPRTIKQAEYLKSFLDGYGSSISTVISFEVDSEILVDRILNRFSCSNCGCAYNKKYNNPSVEGVCDGCGKSDLISRSDDNEEVIVKRIKTYQDQTAPLIEYYSSQSLVHNIDAMDEIENISNKIDFIIKDKQNA